ncbi:exportin 7 [Anaeramoeba flamelloides]|uniref:Exportin 7 n=1 Tax=Anaeramoeba flamelloides TaxID=1746091 RepID=A0ABQ8YD73_9EUKA|nr:exportin 7 [Anaeramoeba flamelloides]
MELEIAEKYAELLYSSVDRNLAVEAEKCFEELSKSTNFLSTCQEYLNSTSNGYLQYWIATEIKKHITTHLHSYSSTQLIELRNFILLYLEPRWKNFDRAILVSFLTLIARIIKLNWDDPEQHDIMKILDSFNSSELADLIITTKVMYYLIEQFSTIIPSSESLLEHRQRSSSFRSNVLLHIMKHSLTILKTIQEQISENVNKNNLNENENDNFLRICQSRQKSLTEDNRELCLLSLKLIFKCLSFDFTGTSYEISEPTTDRFLISLPTNWEEIVQNERVLELLFELYDGSKTLGTKILQIIFYLTSIKQNKFYGEKENNLFLTQLIEGLYSISASSNLKGYSLNEQQNLNFNNENNQNFDSISLDHIENLHQFCRTVFKIIVNYQIRNLIEVQSFGRLIEEIARLTNYCFKNNELENSEYYLIQFWGKLSQTLKFFKISYKYNNLNYTNSSNSDNNNSNKNNNSNSKSGFSNELVPLVDCISEIFKTFISQIFQYIQCEEREEDIEDLENPLEESSRFMINLEAVSNLVLLNYSESKDFINELFDKTFNNYKKYMTKDSGSPNCKISAIQLSILLMLIGKCLGNNSKGSFSSRDNMQKNDSILSSQVFKLIIWNDSFLLQSEQQGIELLEISIIYFLNNFSRIYIKSRNNSQVVIYKELLKSVNISNNGEMLFLILNKIINNLKMWTNAEDLISKNLDFFDQLSQMYKSGRMILKIENINNLFENHTSFNFPFLDYYSEKKWYRSKFYKILGRLLFLDEKKNIIIERFFFFVKPFEERAVLILNKIEKNEAINNNFRKLVTGFLKDIKGLVQSVRNSKSFQIIFNWIYPNFTDLFSQIFSFFIDYPVIVINCLKLWNELTHNRSSRISFPNSSPNGVFLFKIIANSLIILGSHYLNIGSSNNKSNNSSGINIDSFLKDNKNINFQINDDNIHILRLMQETLYNSLSADYINLGIFELYNDETLKNVIDIIILLSCAIPFEKMITYPKLYISLYNLLRIVYQYLLEFIVQKNDEIFTQLFERLIYGMSLPEKEVFENCFLAINSLLQFYFKNYDNKFLKNEKKIQLSQIIHEIFKQNSNLLPYILSILMNFVIFEFRYDESNISYPLLPLLLICEDSFINYRNEIINRVDENEQEQVLLIFENFTNEIQPNLENSNRVKFSEKLNTFRNEIRKFDVHEK